MVTRFLSIINSEVSKRGSKRKNKTEGKTQIRKRSTDHRLKRRQGTALQIIRRNQRKTECHFLKSITSFEGKRGLSWKRGLKEDTKVVPPASRRVRKRTFEKRRGKIRLGGIPGGSSLDFNRATYQKTGKTARNEEGEVQKGGGGGRKRWTILLRSGTFLVIPNIYRILVESRRRGDIMTQTKITSQKFSLEGHHNPEGGGKRKRGGLYQNYE